MIKYIIVKKIKIMENNKSLYSFFENGLFTDISIEINHKIFNLHKIILSNKSDFFAKLFSNGMQESNKTCIKLDNIDQNIFETIIKILYLEEFDFIPDFDTFIKLYETVDYLNIKENGNLINEFIKINNIQDITKLYKYSSDKNDKLIKKKIFKYIRLNLTLILDDKEFKTLIDSLDHEDLNKIIKFMRKKISVCHEDKRDNLLKLFLNISNKNYNFGKNLTELHNLKKDEEDFWYEKLGRISSTQLNFFFFEMPEYILFCLIRLWVSVDIPSRLVNGIILINELNLDDLNKYELSNIKEYLDENSNLLDKETSNDIYKKILNCILIKDKDIKRKKQKIN